MTLRRGGSLISKIHQVSGRVFNRILLEEGIGEINSAQGRILFALWDEDNVPISTLAKKTMLDKSTLTGMLDRLEKDGFIARAPSSGDRRVILITRTDKDKTLQKKYLAVSGRMTDIFYKKFSKSDIDRFEDMLSMVLDNCIEEEKKARP